MTSQSNFLVWQNSRSRITIQNALEQLDCEEFLKVQNLKNQPCLN